MERWKSLYIYFLSGTGNARASSYWIADEAEKRGLETTVIPIDRLRDIVMPSPSDKPLIGFAFPTHGFNAPHLMLKFIAGFPRGLSRQVFLLNTRAGMKMGKIYMPGLSGLALILPLFMLWVKGYKIIALKSVDLPSNWISLHPGLKQKVIESIFQRCEVIVRKFANSILDGNKVYRALISLPVDILISPLALAYYVGGRFFLAKTFVANNKCNNCGICIKECPTASIKIVNNRPYWMLSCESCMKCLNSCPKKAIETAHGMAFLFWFIYSSLSASLALIFIRLLNINPHFWWWKIISLFISILIMIVTVTIVYRLIHYLMGWKPFRNLIRYTSLTALPFWRRYIRNKKY
jgi:Pyruvate/2-oxoacid:ferredoxin oxidoreductase delta subunit